jgi:hypothetical protein
MLRAMIRSSSSRRRSSFAVASFACSAAAVVACAASGTSPGSTAGPGGSNSSTVGTNGDSGFGSFNNGDSGGFGNLGDDGSTGSLDGCQHLDITFIPKTPIVYVLADRSGSEFSGSTPEWVPLRTATLSVIQSLQAEVAFGFGAYTGINPNTTAGMCPILDEVPVAVNNYSAISTEYNALGQPAFKAETPAELTLEHVGQELASVSLAASAGASQPGAKYILFVTDGETDFCDDGTPICPVDAVTAELQKLYTQGIQTLILGIPSNESDISTQALQVFANVGAGLATQAPPLNPGQAPAAPLDIYNQCNSVKGWSALYTAAGLPTGNNLGVSLATYTAPDASTTNATVYSPTSGTDVTSLTNQISAALQTVKSCSFDLQGTIKVNLALASEGSVTIDGAAIPYDATNGWTMSTATQLDLVGTACQSWRATGMNIAFNFPCDVLVPR